MLQEGGSPPVLRVIALQTTHESRRQGSGQKRILAVRLFGAAPSWVAGQIGIRRSDDQAAAPLLVALEGIAGFDRLDLCDSPQHIDIPGFAETDRLWKLRGGDRYIGCRTIGLAESAPIGGTSERHAMESLDMPRQSPTP